MSGQPFRRAGRRGQVLPFRFDGRDYEGYRGDTLAAALLANGVRTVATSVVLGRPRGIFAAWTEEPNAVVQIEHPFPEPMLQATVVELYAGLVATGLPGRGRLAAGLDPARYDGVYAHCDVLVVGAGPAGLAAATAAAGSGARVILADDRPSPGGSLPDTGESVGGVPGTAWAATALAALESHPETRVLTRTSVFGHYDDNYLVAVERRGEDASSRERVWRIRARRVVLATGAHERSIAFAGNDLPGVMLAGSARAYVNRYGVLPGRRAVVFTTGDGAYAAARDLAAAGVEIAAVVDTRAAGDPGGTGGLDGTGGLGDAEVLSGHFVTRANGEHGVISVTVSERPVAGGGPSGVIGSGAVPSGGREIEADLLLVSGGWNPAVHLFSQAGGTLRYDEVLGSFVPGSTRQAVEVAGAARGLRTLAACLEDGAAAGTRAVEAAGLRAPSTSGASVRKAGEAPRAGETSPGAETPRAGQASPDTEIPQAGEAREPEAVSGDGEPSGTTPAGHVWLVPADDYRTHFVDLQRDVTVADVMRATGAGLRSVEHVKRYTTAGTGLDQGKTSGVLTGGVVAHALGVDVSELGTTTFRAPYVPVSFATLAGRDRGALHDPVRVTALHGWHVAYGAPFENVGQWKRPWYYPREGEDMEAAVLRECRAVREAAGAMDASTLGKIDIQGPDAAELLDRLYTNMMSTLKVGSIRYGVMCRPDGMVFDDGTVIRLAEDRFLVTTTTGNAAAVLDWMEEWLQTEWPSLRVYCTSVTEQWATVALAGPRSREVLAGLAPGLAVDNASFPFMTWRDTRVAGLDARVCRISFSGELAYEINVSARDGLALWEAVQATGAVTPYGTETMHVLRAEKGYPIVGQDTDGTVTPADLGMEWVVSKKKADFLGKRSFARADTARPDRKHLVGLLPLDPDVLLPEGSHLVAADRLPEPPVPTLGHVTSSYRSAALGRTFALALVSGGRERVGERLYVPVGGEPLPVTVTHHVLYDPEGARRDGPPAGTRTGPAHGTEPSATGLSGTAELSGAKPRGARSRGAEPSGRPSPPARLEPVSSPGLRIAELPFLTQVGLRVEPGSDTAADIALALGVPLPTEPGTFASTGTGAPPSGTAADDTRVLWLGPDEWLVVGPAGGTGLEARLRAAAGTGHAAVTDVSAQRTVLLVTGPRARDLLSHGCALDLHPRAFGPGRCAQTMLARAQVVIAAREDGGFHILVRSSFADYLVAWLLDAAGEYLGR
ncbi:sarcosine oxidase subunit gamma family protein [Streptosporangium sp. NPDC023825]|uniref:sarcosine oxidase subunit gamma family protein n=1 Tax=Streptosporangium sp. NPDC023825 TaxID=3154909 RepID=UPI003421E31C